MKDTLLGIKVIGWLCVISGTFAGVAIFWQEDYILLGFTFLLNLIMGINLLRKKELARKFMVGLNSISLITALMLALLVPNLVLGKGEEYRQKLYRYADISVKMAKLEKEKPVNEYELVPLTIEAKSLKIALDRYLEYENTMGQVYGRFELINKNSGLNIPNIVGILYMMFIVYYLTRPYVKEKFKWQNQNL